MNLPNGTVLMMYQEYTYCKHYETKLDERWKCSKQRSKCKAYLVLSKVSGDPNFRQVLTVLGEHNHIPARYHLGKNGIYIKI